MTVESILLDQPKNASRKLGAATWRFERLFVRNRRVFRLRHSVQTTVCWPKDAARREAWLHLIRILRVVLLEERHPTWINRVRVLLILVVELLDEGQVLARKKCFRRFVAGHGYSWG